MAGIELDFTNCSGTTDSSIIIKMHVAWNAYEGAQSYKVFFANMGGGIYASTESEPADVSGSKGIYFNEQTDAIEGTSITHTFTTRKIKQRAFVYAYSDKSATTRITQFPLTMLSASAIPGHNNLYLDKTTTGDPANLDHFYFTGTTDRDTTSSILNSKPLVVAGPVQISLLQSVFEGATDPATAIQTAIDDGTDYSVIVAAALQAGTTAIVSALFANSTFAGTTVTITPMNAATIYSNAASPTNIDTTKPLRTVFVDATGAIEGPSIDANTKLAIDLSGNASYLLKDCHGYGIDVSGGVQYLVTPTTTTLINVDDVLVIPSRFLVNRAFIVVDLDLFLIPAQVPDAPTDVTATLTDVSAEVTWTVPADNGSEITEYTVVTSPGGITATTVTNTATVAGLSQNTTYTFSVTATSVAGTSSAGVSPSYTTETTVVPLCFFGNTPVLTPSGYQRIDKLCVGDVVRTPTGTAVIRKIHRREYAAGPHSNPYIIPKGTYGATKRLLISPRHRVAVGGKMVEARHLGLDQEDRTGTLTYYNLGITDRANMVVAGVEVESLAPVSRVIITRSEFDTMVRNGRMNAAFKATCVMLGNGSVCIPIP